MTSPSQPTSLSVDAEMLPMADHDEIGRRVLNQPWDVQKAIVTIAAHCTVIRDEQPTGKVADLASCISHCCAELADALSAPRVEPVAWRSRRKDKDSEYWEAHSQDPTNAIAKYGRGGLEAYIIEPLYATPPSQPDTGVREALEVADNYLLADGQSKTSKIRRQIEIALAALPPDAGSRKPALDPATVEGLNKIEQRLNESGTGEMGLIDTIHAVARMVRALAGKEGA
jgi:hypothetical protein